MEKSNSELIAENTRLRDVLNRFKMLAELVDSGKSSLGHYYADGRSSKPHAITVPRDYFDAVNQALQK